MIRNVNYNANNVVSDGLNVVWYAGQKNLLSEWADIGQDVEGLYALCLAEQYIHLLRRT